MRRDVDVAIVGGGPAGSACAIGCARAGLRVLVVERSRFPREHPGETLPPAIEPLLAHLGAGTLLANADFLRHEGHWVEWNTPPRFTAFGADANGAWRGYQAWRADFDALLLTQAQSFGVEVAMACRAAMPIWEGNRIRSVQLPDRNVTAAWVVDASGARHWLARHLGAEIRACSSRLTARYGYAAGSLEQMPDAPHLRADESGWTWTARVRPQLCAWTRLDVAGDARAPTENLNMPPSCLSHLAPAGVARRADVTWRLVSECAGPGYLMAGDAAAVLDPASSHGVLKAVMSGMLASHTLCRILGGLCEEPTALDEYRHWIRSQFVHDARALNALYRTFPAWDADATEARLTVI